MTAQRIGVSVMSAAMTIGLSFVTLRGVDAGALPPFLSRQAVSVSALGIAPFIYGSVVADLLCRLVPSMKHWGEDRAVRFATLIGIALCLVQAYSAALMLHRGGGPLIAGSGLGAELMTMASLAGGSALALLLARLVDARGAGGGLLLVLGAESFANIDTSSFDALRVASLAGSALLFAALLRRCAQKDPRASFADPPGGLLPMLLGGLVVSASASNAMLGGIAWTGFSTQLGLFPSDPRVLVGASVAVAIGGSALALVLLRRHEEPKLGSAVRAGLINGAVFGTMVILGWYGLGVAPLFGVLMLLDLATMRSGSVVWVSQGETNHHAMVERLRAARISVTTEADTFSRVVPVIGPLAPVRLIVPADQLERAREVLGNTTVAPSAPPPVVLASRRWVTATAAFFFVGLLTLPWIHPKAEAPTPMPASTLALHYIDDDLEPMRLVDRRNPTLQFRMENAPLGRGRTEPREYLLVEDKSAAERDEIAEQFKSILPPNRSLLWELEEDGQTNTYRSYVVITEPIFTSEHLKQARAELSSGGLEEWLVAIELTEEGAQRFEDATRRWTKRRIAIAVDGEIVTAPIVNQVISGGGLTITMGHGRSDSKQAARRLAAALMGEVAPRD